MMTCPSVAPQNSSLLQTHNIPTNIEDPTLWIEQNGFPIRGIISGRGAPTERLAGFVDHFLQPGMKELPRFLQDTKHTLQVLEEVNQNIKSGQVSLDGVGLVSLDVDKMYNNMTEYLGRGACKEYLEGRVSNGGGGNREELTKVVLRGQILLFSLCRFSKF